MNIRIVGRNTGEFNQIETHNNITHLVSFRDGGAEMPDLSNLKKLQLSAFFEFEDLEDATDNEIQAHLDCGFKFASLSDIQLLINFARNNSPDEILFHCNQGKSRSAAAALIYMTVKASVIDEKSLESLWRKLIDIRPIAHPNIWMIKLADHLLFGNGKLTSFVAKKNGYEDYDVNRFPRLLMR